MIFTRWLGALSEWLGEARAWSVRGPRLGCADCPIVMSCGLEPRENCLPRLEAIAAGRRRELGPHDTAILDAIK